MRISDYTIYHPIKNASNEHLMFHTYTGAIDVVGNEVASALDLVKSENNPGLLQKMLDKETFDILKERGYLTGRTPSEEIKFVNELGHTMQSQINNFAIFDIIPSYNCNLKCHYCYESKHKSKGAGWMKKTMDIPMVDSVFSAMDQILDKFKIKSNKIELYGGEPLLKSNFKVIEHLVSRAVDQSYNIVAYSNGVDLHNFKHLLGKEKIYDINIPLDGPAEIHDQRKPGTFHKIVQNIADALEAGCKITIRINVDRNNINAIPELIDHLESKGFLESEDFLIYYAPIYDEPGVEKLVEEDLLNPVNFLKALERNKDALLLANKRRERTRLRVISLLVDDLNGELYPPLLPSFCGANHGLYFFDPHGDIYVCSDAVGQDNWKIGRFSPDFYIDEERLAEWHNRNIMAIPECSKCKYALVCSGGCMINAYNESKDLYAPYCKDYDELLRIYTPLFYEKYLSYDD